MRKFKTILIIDDDDVSNMLTEIEIRVSGLSDKVKIAYNGEEGLHRLKNMKDEENNSLPELILLDINMPVMDGFEFLHEFSSMEFDSVPEVVILTSSQNPKDYARSQTFNIKGYINKPFSAEKLVEILKNN